MKTGRVLASIVDSVFEESLVNDFSANAASCRLFHVATVPLKVIQTYVGMDFHQYNHVT